MHKPKIRERVKKVLQEWLNITPATNQSFSIIEKTSFISEVLRAQLWYRGDSTELFQFFHTLDSGENSFWGSAPSHEKIRKIHGGLPAIIADTLAYIVYSDMDDIDFGECKTGQEAWTEIEEDKFTPLLGKAIVDTLVDGDGAFKISVDTDISPYPIIEFVGADKIEYNYSRGVLQEVIFKTVYKQKSSLYQLEERYGRGYIESRLYNSNGNEMPLDTVPELAGIDPVVEFDGGYIMAVPLKFYASKKYPYRGKSIFDGGKSDCFDALDEVVSQWWDALRAGRIQKYIPECMIPRDPENGKIKSINSFGTEFIAVDMPMKEIGEQPKIDVVQPDIKYDAFVSSYTNCLLMCLQGLVSPATLGIDVGKMQSADAQREKKDVTGNTRNTITTALEKAIPQLVSAVLMTYDNMQSRAPGKYDISVSFGEYGAPDFDSRVETIGKASTYGIMSIETQVEELWGSSKEDEWKKAEVNRIMKEKGLAEGSPHSVGEELA